MQLENRLMWLILHPKCVIKLVHNFLAGNFSLDFKEGIFFIKHQVISQSQLIYTTNSIYK